MEETKIPNFVHKTNNDDVGLHVNLPCTVSNTCGLLPYQATPLAIQEVLVQKGT